MNTEFLMSLLTTPTVSGFETAGSELYESYLRKYVDECSVDILGNAFATLDTDDRFPNIMIEAHIDEIGFQVLYVGDDGCVYVRKNGGIDLQCIPGSRVIIRGSSEDISGVIGKMPIHLQNNQEKDKTPELSSLWIDTGLDAEDVKKKVHIGDVVVLKQEPEIVGDYRITSKALDDKIGVYVVAEVMKRLGNQRNALRCNVKGVATVQEEVGFRGALTGGYIAMPDICISIDVDFATDVPGCSKMKYGDIRLGGGVVIACCLDSDVRIVERMKKIASDNGIQIQCSARPYATGGTNASRIRTIRTGIRTILLGIPCRYMHTPVEMCDLRDVDAAIRLITQFCLQKEF